jgi:hypothetical protein
LGSAVSGAVADSVADSAGSAAADAEVPAGLGLGLGDAKATNDPYDIAPTASTAGTVKNANLRFKLIMWVDLLSGTFTGYFDAPLAPMTPGCHRPVNQP